MASKWIYTGGDLIDTIFINNTDVMSVKCPEGWYVDAIEFNNDQGPADEIKISVRRKFAFPGMVNLEDFIEEDEDFNIQPLSEEGEDRESKWSYADDDPLNNQFTGVTEEDLVEETPKKKTTTKKK